MEQRTARKNCVFLHIQNTNTKNFCDTPVLKLNLLANCERPGY